MRNKGSVTTPTLLTVPANHDRYLTWYQRLLSRHRYALSSAIGRISRTPIATFMTISVIGLALALPAGLLLLIHQTQRLTQYSSQGTQISIFLKQTSDQGTIDRLLDQLSQDPRVISAHYLSPTEVMEQFQNAAGIERWVNEFDENPLPGVIEIIPAHQLYNVAAINQLVDELKQEPQVDIAQLDLEWITRLQAIIAVIRQATWLLLGLIGVGVSLVIANTIRLIQELYRDESEVMRLVGASQGFIRLPFTYTGLFYGVFGGIVAWLILDFFLLWLRQPLQEVFNLYHSRLQASELDIRILLILITVGAIFGLIGSLSSVFIFSLKQEREIIL